VVVIRRPQPPDVRGTLRTVVITDFTIAVLVIVVLSLTVLFVLIRVSPCAENFKLCQEPNLLTRSSDISGSVRRIAGVVSVLSALSNNRFQIARKRVIESSVQPSLHRAAVPTTGVRIRRIHFVSNKTNLFTISCSTNTEVTAFSSLFATVVVNTETNNTPSAVSRNTT